MSVEPPKRSFQTPLFEVVSEIQLDPAALVEFPALSMHGALGNEYPTVQSLNTTLVGDPAQAFNMWAPGYRFFNRSQTMVVQLGPRLIALNALMAKSPWGGWTAFKDACAALFETYARLNAVSPVMRFSLSFYNRVDVADLAEAREFFPSDIPAPRGSLAPEFSYQYAFSSESGTVVRLFAMQSDMQTGRSFLAVNTLVRTELAGVPFAAALPQWHDWVDCAHDLSKKTLFDSLSPAARSSWKPSSATETTAS